MYILNKCHKNNAINILYLTYHRKYLNYLFDYAKVLTIIIDYNLK